MGVRAGCPGADPPQASGDLNSSDGYSEAQSGLCTALLWPKKGWNPRAVPSHAHSVHKPISASGLSLESGQGSSALWRGWGEQTHQIRHQQLPTQASGTKGWTEPWNGCPARHPTPCTNSPCSSPGFPTCKMAAMHPPLLISQKYGKEPKEEPGCFLEHSKDIIFYSLRRELGKVLEQKRQTISLRL